MIGHSYSQSFYYLTPVESPYNAIGLVIASRSQNFVFASEREMSFRHSVDSFSGKNNIAKFV
jgi:hypothetical protein